MIDISPVLALLALIAGPVLVAHSMTGGEPVDLPELVAMVMASPTERRRFESRATLRRS